MRRELRPYILRLSYCFSQRLRCDCVKSQSPSLDFFKTINIAAYFAVVLGVSAPNILGFVELLKIGAFLYRIIFCLGWPISPYAKFDITLYVEFMQVFN